jgi:ABC-type phosphonate transport system ATPase subunit
MPNSPVVEVSNLVRTFGNRTVIDNLSFQIERGETMVIMPYHRRHETERRLGENLRRGNHDDE